MVRKWALITALVVVLIGIGSWIANRLAMQPGPRAVNFPDGTRMHLLGSANAATTFSSDPFWMIPLRKLLPPRMLPPALSMSCSSGDTNEIVTYFDADTQSARLPWTWLTAVDADGFRYPMSGGCCSTSRGSRQLYGVTLSAFPRRQKWFTLEMLDSDHRVLATTRVLNPLPVPPPVKPWRAQPLPQTRTNGELVLTLVAARELTNQWGSQLQPQWKIESLAPRWQHPKSGYLRIEDALGNVGGFLSRREPVWKLSVTYHKRRREDFGADEKLVLSGLSVPRAAEIIPIAISQNCNSVLLQPQGIFGPGTLYVTNGTSRTMVTNVFPSWSMHADGRQTVEAHGADEPFILLEASGMRADDELHLELHDENGRSISVKNQAGYHSRNNSTTRVYQFIFSPTNEVQALNMEIIVSRPKEFSFFINPADIQLPAQMPSPMR